MCSRARTGANPFLAVAAVALGGASAFSPTAHGEVIEEVIVTSRKVEERLIDTPVAVTAFSSEMIESRGIEDIADLAAFTPGMTFAATSGTSSSVNRSTPTLVIRGMAPSLSNTATTTIFVDGVPLVSGYVEGVGDVERIEVVKGPQSATFGRETFAGAINFITKAPADVFGGHISALAGSDEWIDGRLSVEGPIVPGLAAIRVSARYYNQDGQYANNGVPGERLGDRSTKSASARFSLTPGEHVRVNAFASYYEHDDGPGALAKFSRQDYNCNAGGAPAGQLNFICGAVPDFDTARLASNTTVTPTVRNVLFNNSLGVLGPIYRDGFGLDQGGLRQESTFANLSIEYELERLGLTISSLTGGERTRYATLADQDNTNTVNLPNPISATNPNVREFINFDSYGNALREDWSQELRIASDWPSRFNWAAGLNYNYSLRNNATGSLRSAGPVRGQAGNPVVTRTPAVFGRLEYKVRQNFTLSAEGRSQRDEVSAYNRLPIIMDGYVLNTSAAFENFLYRLIAQYWIVPDVQVYVSNATGVNPGTFNAQFVGASQQRLDFLHSLGADIAVDPETIDNYELGIKGRFWDGRAQLAAAVYYANWKDQIVNQLVAFPVFDAAGNPTGLFASVNIATNAGETIVQGVEVESILRPTPEVTIDLAGSISDTNIREYVCIICQTLTGSSVIEGTELPGTSKYYASIGAEYQNELGRIADWTWFARTDYSYRSGLWDSAANIVKSESAYNLDVRLGMENEKFVVEAFVLNAQNDKAYTGLENNVDVLTPGFSDRVVNAALPTLRQYGLRARYSF